MPDSLFPLTRLPEALAGSDRAVALAADRCHSGRDFARAVGQLAAPLAERRASRFALCADDAWLFAVGLFALWHAGKGVVVPNNFLPATLAGLFGTFDAVLDDDALRTMLAEHAAAPLPLAELDPERTTLTLFTSGSTGEPKRIEKCLRQLAAEVAVQEAQWGASLGEAPVLATVPHHHIYGLLFRLLLPLSGGRAFEIAPAFAPEDLLARARLLGRVSVVSSPAQLTRMPALVDLTELAPRLALCFSSGGPLPLDAAQAFAAAVGQAPVEVFGSTETGGIAWRRQGEVSTPWTPFASVLCAQDRDGALSVRSPFLPDAAPWLCSDAAEFLDDGRFVLKGRLDRVVKLEEKRLSLPEQEARLAEHPWVSAAALLVRPGRRQTLCAVLALSADGVAAQAHYAKRDFDRQLRTHLARHYEPVLLPRRWRHVAALPLTERGKLCQRSLNALFDPS
jgi:acyl-coenzyme A synthetase/AMP-(fatty) acid ligase